MQRIWLAALGLLVWQLGSMAFGFNECMFGHPAQLPAILASLVTAVAWMALAAWGGDHHRGLFGIADLIARWPGVSRSARRQGPLQPVVPPR